MGILPPHLGKRERERERRERERERERRERERERERMGGGDNSELEIVGIANSYNLSLLSYTDTHTKMINNIFDTQTILQKQQQH